MTEFIPHAFFEEGQRVRVYPSGVTGKVYKRVAQAVHTIPRYGYTGPDRTPYTIQLDKDGSFIHAIGDDLVKISDPSEDE